MTDVKLRSVGVQNSHMDVLRFYQGEGCLLLLDAMEGGNSDNVWASESGLHRSSTQLWNTILKASYYIVQPALGRPQLPHQVQVNDAARSRFNSLLSL